MISHLSNLDEDESREHKDKIRKFPYLRFLEKYGNNFKPEIAEKCAKHLYSYVFKDFKSALRASIMKVNYQYLF